MWATLVNRDGVVCAVAFSGVNRGAQWPGSRAISAQKANTAMHSVSIALPTVTALDNKMDWRCPRPTCIQQCNPAAVYSVCREQSCGYQRRLRRAVNSQALRSIQWS